MALHFTQKLSIATTVKRSSALHTHSKKNTDTTLWINVQIYVKMFFKNRSQINNLRMGSFNILPSMDLFIWFIRLHSLSFGSHTLILIQRFFFVTALMLVNFGNRQMICQKHLQHNLKLQSTSKLRCSSQIEYRSKKKKRRHIKLILEYDFRCLICTIYIHSILCSFL